MLWWFVHEPYPELFCPYPLALHTRHCSWCCRVFSLHNLGLTLSGLLLNVVLLPLISFPSLNTICTYRLDYFTFSHYSPAPGPKLPPWPTFLLDFPCPMSRTQIRFPACYAHSVSRSWLTLSSILDAPFIPLCLYKLHSVFVLHIYWGIQDTAIPFVFTKDKVLTLL